VVKCYVLFKSKGKNVALTMSKKKTKKVERREQVGGSKDWAGSEEVGMVIENEKYS
jgi:hypothetical protein